MGKNIIYYFLLFAFALGGWLLKSYVFPTIKSIGQLDPDTLDGLAKWALKLCRAAKNMVDTLTTAADRRQWVMDQLEALSQKAGLNLTEEQKRALLEAAYDEMNATDATDQAAAVITHTARLTGGLEVQTDIEIEDEPEPEKEEAPAD